MAIRFQCGACTQPIEIDDEWASKTVACPYCRKTITAPATSTLGDVRDIPTASPLAPVSMPGEAEFGAIPNLAVQGEPKNRIAVVAIALAFGMIALLVTLSLVVQSHSLELEQFQKALDPTGSFTDNLTAQTDFYKKHGGMPPWLIAIGVLYVGAGLTWIATLVCGILGVRRPHRRPMAIAALVIAGITPIAFCCGGGMPA